jgi:hypothetical protein
VAGRHQVAVLADLAILGRAVRALVGIVAGGILRWRCRRGRRVVTVSAGASTGRARSVDGHVVDTLVELAKTQLLKLLLEELQIAAAVAELRVEPGANAVVVCL